MKKIHIVYVVFFSLIFFSCSENSITESSLERGLNFYLLKDPHTTANQVYNSDIYSLKLAERPFLSYKDLVYYKWSEHSFKIDSINAKTIQNICKNNTTVFGIPFVVTVGQERIYLGAFWFLFSSLAPVFPHINSPIENGENSCIFVINKSWDSTKTDLRNDPRIYNVLKKYGLLLD
jgi:hypothetical protein